MIIRGLRRIVTLHPINRCQQYILITISLLCEAGSYSQTHLVVSCFFVKITLDKKVSLLCVPVCIQMQLIA